jgi:hypothetical protein
MRIRGVVGKRCYEIHLLDYRGNTIATNREHVQPMHTDALFVRAVEHARTLARWYGLDPDTAVDVLDGLPQTAG